MSPQKISFLFLFKMLLIGDLIDFIYHFAYILILLLSNKPLLYLFFYKSNLGVIAATRHVK